MASLNKLLILGAGSVGGYFGARLIEAGADVTFLLRCARAAQLQNDGLQLRSPHGDVRMPVRCVTRDTVTATYDLVVLAPKAFDLDDALDAITPALSADTLVLPLLNGYAHMAVLDARFGAHRVLGGVAHVAAQRAADGAIEQLSPVHALTVGGRCVATQRAATEFIAVCSPARFNAALSTDITTALWEKWTFLATLAALTTLMQGAVGEVMDTADGALLVRRLHAECVAVAEHSGVACSERATAKALHTLTERGSALTASMWRDLQAGLRTEHDHVLGDLLHRARTLQVDTPLLAAAYCHLQVVTRRRRAGAAG
jgi:2-dehydropantoate 2-reductase